MASSSPTTTSVSWRVTQGRILAIAWPVMLSNITVPLLGLVDSAILGHLPDATHLGAVAIGAQLFTLLCWSFGFLRMGTTSLTARSHSDSEHRQVLTNALWLAIPLALALTVVGGLLLPLAIPLMDASPEVAAGAASYLAIRAFSVPAVLVQYCLLGWFIGRGETRIPLVIMTITNLVNGVLDYVLVFGVGMTVDGVALGSVIADYSGVAIGLWFAFRHCRPRLNQANSGQTNPGQTEPGHRSGIRKSLLQLWQQRPGWHRLRPMIRVNHELFVRTLTLLLVFTFFNAQGAQQGELVLATNSLIITLLLLISNALDGVAHAAESLSGQALSRLSASTEASTSSHSRQDDESQAAEVRQIIRISGVNSLALALLLTLAFAIGAEGIWALLTDNPALLPVLQQYQHWLILLPLVGFWSYWLDGLCIGAGASDVMRNAMLAAAVLVFLPLWWLTEPFGNTGLWSSFYAFLIARAIFVIPFTIRLYQQPVIYAPAHPAAG